MSFLSACRSVLIFAGCLFSSLDLYSQSKDSVVVKDSLAHYRFPRMVYVRAMPLGIYSGAGYLQDRITQNIELGNSFGVIDVGLAYGKTALRPDTAGNGTHYLEGKITMNLCQFGIVANEMTVGAGGVFDSRNGLMLELSYTIYAQFWQHVGIGIITGYYDYSGNTTDSQHNMFGLFARYGLGRAESGGLLNIGRITHMRSMRHR